MENYKCVIEQDILWLVLGQLGKARKCHDKTEKLMT